MNRILLLSLCLSCLLMVCRAQPKEAHYKSSVIKGDKLYALTATGNINSFNANTGAVINLNIHADDPIISIALDKKQNVYVLTKDSEIALFDEKTLRFNVEVKSTDPIYDMLFDSKNDMYLVGSKGVVNVSANTIYYPSESFSLNKQVNVWPAPSADFMDSNDIIWVGGDHGEWGGQLSVFDTKNLRFIKPDVSKARDGRFSLFELNGIHSFCTDGSNVYLSMGLIHMMTTGAIVKFKDFKCDTVLVCKDHWEADHELLNTKHVEGGEFIGPLIYSAKNSSLYFYSQDGVFKGNTNTDLTKLQTWTKVFQPGLHWTAGRIDAVGSPMNVMKMELAANGNIFLITENDGIGMYDGKTFKLLN